MSKKTEGQKARELVKKHTGQEPQRDSLGRHYTIWWVVVGDTVLSWDEDKDGKVVSIHTRRVGDEPDSQTDYFPGRFHDTIQAGIKSVTMKSRRAYVVGGSATNPDLRVTLGWKATGGFVRQAVFTLTRWVEPPQTARHRLSGVFDSESFVLYDDEALSMAQAFIDGDLPAGILLDWLRDRDAVGMSNERPYGRHRDAKVVTGRLEAFLARPAGKMRHAAGVP